MITTYMLSRGLDFSPNVRHVFIVDEPRNMVDFLHRSGRSARAGQLWQGHNIWEVGGYGIQGQKALADAAKTAGVKIFSPSEYGSPSVKAEGEMMFKGDIHDHLRGIELPYTIFYTGPWSDMILDP